MRKLSIAVGAVDITVNINNGTELEYEKTGTQRSLSTFKNLLERIGNGAASERITVFSYPDVDTQDASDIDCLFTAKHGLGHYAFNDTALVLMTYRNLLGEIPPDRLMDALEHNLERIECPHITFNWMGSRFIAIPVTGAKDFLDHAIINWMVFF